MRIFRAKNDEVRRHACFREEICKWVIDNGIEMYIAQTGLRESCPDDCLQEFMNDDKMSEIDVDKVLTWLRGKLCKKTLLEFATMSVEEQRKFVWYVGLFTALREVGIEDIVVVER